MKYKPNQEIETLAYHFLDDWVEYKHEGYDLDREARELALEVEDLIQDRVTEIHDRGI